MKKLILYFIILALAIWLGVWMHGHPGYMLIGVDNTRIELSLWLAVFALLLVVVLCYWLLRLLHGVFHVPERFRSWRKHRKAYKVLRLSEQGVYSILTENWKKAEADLIKSAEKLPPGTLSYVGAALAAQAQKNYVSRDQYLQNAQKSANKRQLIAVTMAQARWQIDAGQWDDALKTLQSLQQVEPQHPFVLRGLQQVYYTKRDWEALRQLLPKLKQQHLLQHDELVVLEHEVYLSLMAQARATNQPQILEKIWQILPDYLRKEPAVLATYIEYLIEEGNHEKAESLLKLRLRKSLEVPLLQQYAQVVSNNSARQLARAEAWLAHNPDNAALLYCLGILCARHRLWGKARSYLESSNELEPRAEVYIALGSVLEHLGEKSAALECYHKGLTRQQIIESGSATP